MMGCPEEVVHAAGREILRINPKYFVEQYVRTSRQRYTAPRERIADALRKAGLKLDKLLSQDL